MPGPVPKRSEERRRRNQEAGPISRAPALRAWVPEPDELWHPVAKAWFRSLGTSGQQAFYQDSDWATARYIAEAMSRNLTGKSFSAVLFAAVLSGAGSLLATEGDRRRLRVELERGGVDEDELAAVTALDRFRGVGA